MRNDKDRYWDCLDQAMDASHRGRMEEALAWQERTAERAGSASSMLPGVLYDLAVIRLANKDKDGAREALAQAVDLEPKLEQQAKTDSDLAGIND